MYISVCRDLLQQNSPLDQVNDEKWEESARKLRRLRLLLLCRVCKNLSADPYHSGSCQHLICRDCKEKRGPVLRGCRFCKNLKLLEIDKQAVSVLSCYAKLCDILHCYGVTEKETVRSKRIFKIWDIVLEGVGLANNLKKKSIKVAEDGLVDNEITSESFSKREIDHANDAGGFCNQNNVSKDGGSKDGRHNKDGGIKDGRQNLNSEIMDCIVASNESIKTELKNGFSADFEEEEQIFISSSSSERKEKRPDKNAITKTSKEILEDGQLIKATYVKDIIDDGEEANGEAFSTNSFYSQSKLDSTKNGIIKQSFLLEKDFNCTPQTLTSKRKLRNSTSSEDRGHLYSLKIKKKKEKNDEKECKIEVSVESVRYNGERKELLKGQHPANQEGYDDHESFSKEAKNNGHTKSNIERKDLRKSHENCNLTPKTKLYRKNKYKCSCGSTGMKFYSDICSHERCACFAAEVPCTNCKCKFCSNPYKTVSDRKVRSSLSKNQKNGVEMGDHDNVHIDIVS